MKYEELPEEMRKGLEEKKYVAIRYSSKTEDANDKVDDAFLIDHGSKMDVSRLHGYSVSSGKGSSEAWFNFVSAPYADQPEKCVELVENALASVM